VARPAHFGEKLVRDQLVTFAKWFDIVAAHSAAKDELPYMRDTLARLIASIGTHGLAD